MENKTGKEHLEMNSLSDESLDTITGGGIFGDLSGPPIHWMIMWNKTFRFGTKKRLNSI